MNPNPHDVKPARTVAIMIAITIAGKVLGLLRERMQATQLGGDTVEGIAFAQASFLPRGFLDIMFAAAFSASFIPVFSMYMETKGEKAAFDLAALFISVVGVLTAAVAIISIIFARPILILSLGSGEFPYGTIDLGVTLLRLMFPLMVLSGLAFSFTGMLQSLGEFRVPAAMSAVSNTIILIYYFFFLERFGVYGLAITFLVGWGAQGLIQIPFLLKHKFKFRFRFNLKDPGLRQIGKLALPVMVSTWVVPVNIAVNVRASGGGIDVPSIHFANTLFMIISGVFILSVSNVIFPKLSRQAAVKDEKAFGGTINETVRVLLFFLLPLTLGIMALSRPLVEFILGGNLFVGAPVKNTATALFFFAIGIVGFGLFAVLSRACYARMDGRTPIVAAVTAIAVNAALSFILAPYMQVAGPALANAISQTAGAAILVLALTHKKILTWNAQTISQIARMIFCAAVMLVVVLICLRQTENLHVILQVVLSAVVGMVVYLGLAVLVRVKEMKWAKENILKR